MKLGKPVILFLGRSNVGKSSLLNALAGHSLAHVSKTPGKTRSVNYYRFGPDTILVDLPGYGYAKRSKVEKGEWAKLVEEFFPQVPLGSLAFVLMDSRRDLGQEEFSLMESLADYGHKIQLILTKADQLNQSARQKRIKYQEQNFDGEGQEKVLTWSLVSVKTGEGIENLRSELEQYGKEFKT